MEILVALSKQRHSASPLLILVSRSPACCAIAFVSAKSVKEGRQPNRISFFPAKEGCGGSAVASIGGNRCTCRKHAATIIRSLEQVISCGICSLQCGNKRRDPGRMEGLPNKVTRKGRLEAVRAPYQRDDADPVFGDVLFFWSM